MKFRYKVRLRTNLLQWFMEHTMYGVRNASKLVSSWVFINELNQ